MSGSEILIFLLQSLQRKRCFGGLVYFTLKWMYIFRASVFLSIVPSGTIYVLPYVCANCGWDHILLWAGTTFCFAWVKASAEWDQNWNFACSIRKTKAQSTEYTPRLLFTSYRMSSSNIRMIEFPDIRCAHDFERFRIQKAGALSPLFLWHSSQNYKSASRKRNIVYHPFCYGWWK